VRDSEFSTGKYFYLPMLVIIVKMSRELVLYYLRVM